MSQNTKSAGVRLILGSLLASSLGTGIAAQCANSWRPGLAAPGVGGGLSFQLGGEHLVPVGTVGASVLWDPDGPGPLPARIVVGGSFRYCGGSEANNIAAIDPVSGAVTAFGNGLNGVVWALAAAPNGDLFAAGAFTSAGGSAASRVARWNGTAWLPLGTGCDDVVQALALLPNGDLVAGGFFTSAGGVSAARIARWNGATWNALGTGTSGHVWALVTLPNGDLVAGGAFNQAGNVAAANVARWDGTAWSALGTGYPSGPAGAAAFVYSLAVRANGELLCGGQYGWGQFTNGRVIQWNGTQWSAVGGDLGSVVWSLHELPNGHVVAGTGLGVDCGQVWDGAVWSPLGGGLPHSIRTVVQLPNGDLVVGGDFVHTPGGDAHHLARWNGTTWSPLVGGTSGTVATSAVLPNGDLVVGGDFQALDGVAAVGLARRSGASWSALNIGVYYTLALAVGNAGQLLVAGSTGTGLGDSVVTWNGAQTTPLGTSSDGSIRALRQLPNGSIVAAGTFTTIGGIAVSNLAIWNGTVWAPLGGGTNGDVHALAVLRNGDLVAAGTFTSAGGTAANRIASWNGIAWSPLGSGLGGIVRALQALPNGDLIAGGGFATAGGIPAACAARWNGTSWSAIGSGLANANTTSYASALALLPNGDLVLGGEFPTLSSPPNLPTLARWNGTAWSNLGGGTSDSVACLAVLPNGDLVAGGAFTMAGDRVSSLIAQLTTSCPATATSFGSGCVGSGGPVALAALTLPWLGSTYRAVASGLPANAIAIEVLGLSAVSVPLPTILPQGIAGCTLWAASDVLLLYLPAAAQVTTALQLPNSASLVGAVLHQQVLPVELSLTGAISGLTGSNALVLTVGSF